MPIARHNENNSFLSLVIDRGRFSYLHSGTASLSYQFLSVSKTLYKIKILQKFPFGRKLFDWSLTPDRNAPVYREKTSEPTWLNAGARILPIWQTRDAKSLLPHKLRLSQLHEIFPAN